MEMIKKEGDKVLSKELLGRVDESKKQKLHLRSLKLLLQSQQHN